MPELYGRKSHGHRRRQLRQFAADPNLGSAVAAEQEFEAPEGLLLTGRGLAQRLLDQREVFLEDVLANNTKAWELAKTQYEVGKIDLLSVLQMQARVVGSQIGVVNIRNDRLINRVNLHLALGGSFEEDPEKRVIVDTAE